MSMTQNLDQKLVSARNLAKYYKSLVKFLVSDEYELRDHVSKELVRDDIKEMLEKTYKTKKL